jgi:hypothetical protein
VDLAAGASGVHRALVDALLGRLHIGTEIPTPEALGAALAPEDEPPTDSEAADAWRVLVSVADRLYGSAVAPLGRLPFISDRLLELMRDEARDQLGECPDAGARVTAPGGRSLSALAVSRKLQAALGAGLGVRVAPGYRALYAYDPPGSHVRTHLDSREYELIFHMIITHRPPGDGSPGSALVAHLPGRENPRLVSLRPGEAVALSGRGTLHSWQRLGPDERRTMVEIAWTPA